MLEPGSLAIEAARAAIGDAQAAAQCVHRLTQGRVQACEGLLAALQRWPSFVVADPWAIATPMTDNPPPAEPKAAEKRVPAWREAPRPAAGRATPGAIPGATASRPRPVAATPVSSTQRPPQAPTPESPVARDIVDAVTNGALSPAAATTVGAAASQASALAAIVAQAIARHVPPGLVDAAASGLPWSDLLPPESDDASTTTSASRSHSAEPRESPAVLQALDLPTRAALGNVARADSGQTSPGPFAPAADMLRRLLPDVLSGSPLTEPAVAVPPRVAAPRAPSRLLSATANSTVTPATGSRPVTPARTPADPGDEGDPGDDAIADAISRQLADQAWLRGTDFT